ncbi:MAG: PTS fructose transporter subunit IIA [Burkholderiaceae bacterium]|jgi:mannose PTS system EIIA component|nr:PTS fructose transporter subunit IIA [Burkholderiaceae bacterium]
MTAIVVIAHAPLASALRACVAHVFPDDVGCVQALDVPATDQVDAVFEQAKALLPSHGEALVLTDMFGATPANVASRLASVGGCRVLAGVNLPMLLRAVCYRDQPVDQLVIKAVAGGTQGIMPVVLTAPQNQPKRAHDPQDHHHQQ